MRPSGSPRCPTRARRRAPSPANASRPRPWRRGPPTRASRGILDTRNTGPARTAPPARASPTARPAGTRSSRTAGSRTDRPLASRGRSDRRSCADARTGRAEAEPPSASPHDARVDHVDVRTPVRDLLDGPAGDRRAAGARGGEDGRVLALLLRGGHERLLEQHVLGDAEGDDGLVRVGDEDEAEGDLRHPCAPPVPPLIYVLVSFLIVPSKGGRRSGDGTRVCAVKYNMT